MNDIIAESAFFGVMISLLAYEVGVLLKRKINIILFSPLLIAIVVTMVVLHFFDIEYEVYYEGAKYLSYLLTPATICLAILLYEQVERLKNNWKAIVVGISTGVFTSLISVWALSILIGFDHQEYVTLLPKSITTAIGMDLSRELGGYVPITVAVIVITGLFGNMVAELVCKWFRIEEPVAKGIAIGTASHAMGTTKAMELGEVEGAMSSLSIAVAGLLTVVGASFFAEFM